MKLKTVRLAQKLRLQFPAGIKNFLHIWNIFLMKIFK